jgi:hypothetical protein
MAYIYNILESKSFKDNCQEFYITTPQINEIVLRCQLPVLTSYPIPEVGVVDWVFILIPRGSILNAYLHPFFVKYYLPANYQ